MYGTLTLHDQQLAIEPAPEGQRKVVLATNVAESSLTIDGITTVVDGGLERAPQYDPGTGMSRLHTRRISQASATQRAGRAGRLAPGQCFRLWSEDQQAQLQAQTPPEILQADLSQTALQVLAWGVDAVSELAWLDEPPAGAWSQALDLLAGFGAIEKIGGSWRVTPEGEHMARLPAHPRLAHMLLQANLLGLREEAYQLAAILSERDPFRDQGADIELRLAVLDEQEACPRSLRGWRTRVQRQVPFFKVMCRDLPTGSVPQADIGSLIAIAYPDRIARRRQQKGNIYQLSNGRSARLDESDPLCNCEWLAVAELGGIAGRSEDRIYLAARLDPERFEDVLAGLVDSNEQVEWSDKTERFLAESQRRIGAIVLSRDPLSDVPAAAKQEALLTLVRERGLDLLPWSEELRQWQARVNLLYRELGPPWPDLSEQALLVSLEDWLGPYLDGVNKLADFGKLDLGNILQARLAWPLPRELEELAPQRFEVPSGSSIRIDYTVSPPVLAVKLQEMFGARETPAVARGKVPLVIHLLSPAKRPLQVTQDLVSFWQNGYAEVRKEMQGRYPKHPWPEDPLEAQATAKTKRHLK
jgi:ATP-dependent helicase HrpB